MTDLATNLLYYGDNLDIPRRYLPDAAVAHRLGINRTDLRCLDWLYEGPMTAGQLGGAIGLSSAATTTLLDRLERLGSRSALPGAV